MASWLGDLQETFDPSAPTCVIKSHSLHQGTITFRSYQIALFSFGPLKKLQFTNLSKPRLLPGLRKRKLRLLELLERGGEDPAEEPSDLEGLRRFGGILKNEGTLVGVATLEGSLSLEIGHWGWKEKGNSDFQSSTNKKFPIVGRWLLVI